MKKLKKIFEEGRIRDLIIKNRIVLPPMVTFNFADKDGFVSKDNIGHYDKISKDGPGLLIVEATCINKKGKLSKDQLEIGDDKYIEGLSKIGEVCHDNGAKIFIQLHHAGLRTRKEVTDDLVSSSDYDDGKVKARAMTLGEIREVQDDFVAGALRAEKAGLDGIELHGAHSYLFTQFFSKKVNKREDEYGGSLENRLRIVKEIIDRIREEVSPNFVIGIRMGSNENSLEESIQMAKTFEEYGFDYLHVSTGFDNTPIEEEVPEDFPCNWIVYGGCKIKDHVNIPVIIVNGIKTQDQVAYIRGHNLADFVAVGRGQLADHNFVKHIQDNEEIIFCLGCRPCKWFTDGRECPRYSYNI